MKPVTVYSTQVCGYCMRAKALLDSKHIPYTEFLVDAEPARRDEMLKKSGGMHTVPQIFIGDQHVGGYTELYQLDSRGGLDAMLAD
ncbi:MAG: glutaredoxin 3 [Gammaproteobacteria bacterium]